jgi:hypothetical protein
LIEKSGDATKSHGAKPPGASAENSYMGVAFKANHINASVAKIFGICVTEVTAAMLNDLTKEFYILF